MARILIIGYGNPLRSDDGLGWHVAGELAGQFSSPEIEVLRTYQLTPELADQVSRADLAIFIDACEGGLPGDIEWKAIDNEHGQPMLHSHDLSPAVILQLARELYGRTARAYLVTVAGQDFGEGDSLSKPVLSALPNVIAKVKTLISQS